MSSRAITIVPTFNESENLKTLVEKVLSLPGPMDLLIIDDNSPDGTGELADRFAAEQAGIHVLHRPEKRGLGRAYCEGFAWALEREYDLILQMDGDLSHDPSDIPRFLNAAAQSDLVVGSRYANGIRVINWPLNRLMLSLSAASYVKWVTGMPFTDPTSGYKCFSRAALKSIPLQNVRSNGYSFQIEMTHIVWRQGMQIREIPIIFTDRFQGTSKMSGKIVREALGMVWRLWFQNGLHRNPRLNNQ